jgi:ribosomal protein S3AE
VELKRIPPGEQAITTTGGQVMKKEVEELIRILAKEEEKKELLKEIIKDELRSMVKELLEEVALVEREAFCESEGEAKNGFYPRDI